MKDSKVLVSMWIYESDRDYAKVEAAQKKKLMPDIIREWRLAALKNS